MAFAKPTIKPFTRDAMWFDFLGIQSSHHGKQLPIALTFLPTDSPITKGMSDWTTIGEELYNNVQVFDTATPLIRGKQGAGDKKGENDTVVIMHNDGVVQGLSEVPFMQDVRRWGVLTIGTGLGNARFSNRQNGKDSRKE